MVKLAENAYRDVNIAFANELSLVCRRLGLDAWEIRRLANHHPRVQILRPGPGVGGHCVAVDPWFIVAAAPQETRLTRAARDVNDQMPARVAGQIIEACGRLAKPAVACLGLSFKADVADLRQSPAVDVAARVAAALPDVKILAVEPHATALPGPLGDRGNVVLADAASAVADASVIALLTDHRCFRDITPGQLDGKVVVDTRGMWR
jgi:UDP-N-acetyl-D-mannosaminuronic acid dehydrogenase